MLKPMQQATALFRTKGQTGKDGMIEEQARFAMHEEYA
jgi:hypothetical protein